MADEGLRRLAHDREIAHAEFGSAIAAGEQGEQDLQSCCVRHESENIDQARDLVGVGQRAACGLHCFKVDDIAVAAIVHGGHSERGGLHYGGCGDII